MIRIKPRSLVPVLLYALALSACGEVPQNLTDAASSDATDIPGEEFESTAPIELPGTAMGSCLGSDDNEKDLLTLTLNTQRTVQVRMSWSHQTFFMPTQLAMYQAGDLSSPVKALTNLFSSPAILDVSLMPGDYAIVINCGLVGNIDPGVLPIDYTVELTDVSEVVDESSNVEDAVEVAAVDGAIRIEGRLASAEDADYFKLTPAETINVYEGNGNSGGNYSARMYAASDLNNAIFTATGGTAPVVTLDAGEVYYIVLSDAISPPFTYTFLLVQ